MRPPLVAVGTHDQITLGRLGRLGRVTLGGTHVGLGFSPDQRVLITIIEHFVCSCSFAARVDLKDVTRTRRQQLKDPCGH